MRYPRANHQVIWPGASLRLGRVQGGQGVQLQYIPDGQMVGQLYQRVITLGARRAWPCSQHPAGRACRQQQVPVAWVRGVAAFAGAESIRASVPRTVPVPQRRGPFISAVIDQRLGQKFKPVLAVRQYGHPSCGTGRDSVPIVNIVAGVSRRSIRPAGQPPSRWLVAHAPAAATYPGFQDMPAPWLGGGR